MPCKILCHVRHQTTLVRKISRIYFAHDFMSRKISFHVRFHVTQDVKLRKISRSYVTQYFMSRKIERHVRFHLT